MAKYKYILKFRDGDTIDSQREENELFDSEWEAEDAATEALSNCKLGNKNLNMHNPGDYELDDYDDVETIIVEVED